jgi:hypothetical protein
MFSSFGTGQAGHDMGYYFSNEESFSNNGLWGRYFEVLSSENWNNGFSRRYRPVLNRAKVGKDSNKTLKVPYFSNGSI